MLICVDLDGTLLDTIPANAASYRAALEEQGFTVTDEYYAQYCNGGYYKQFLRPLMGGDPAPEAVERVHDRKKELYSSCLPMVRPNTSLLAILQAMKAAAVTARIVSAVTGWASSLVPVTKAAPQPR